MPHLFCFGYGYTARRLSRRLLDTDWQVSATCRTSDNAKLLAADGVDAVAYGDEGRQPALAASFGTTSHILVSIPPDEYGDLVVRRHSDVLVRLAPQLNWLGYLSTTGVYGDRGGDWVDETAGIAPTTERGRRRAQAEQDWAGLGAKNIPVHIFRLAGIYGPGRNQLEALKTGRARSIVKPGQVFGRIHVDDIVAILRASMANTDPGAAYNVCDDEPAPPQDVIAYAAGLLGLSAPPEIAFEQSGLSQMAQSFYAENKRVSNAKVKRELGVKLAYPTYREGLRVLFEEKV